MKSFKTLVLVSRRRFYKFLNIKGFFFDNKLYLCSIYLYPFSKTTDYDLIILHLALIILNFNSFFVSL